METKPIIVGLVELCVVEVVELVELCVVEVVELVELCVVEVVELVELCVVEVVELVVEVVACGSTVKDTLSEIALPFLSVVTIVKLYVPTAKPVKLVVIVDSETQLPILSSTPFFSKT